MNNFKDSFSKLTSEHLLEKRALGNELADDAHLAIEEIFLERGEFLPPRPLKPIFAKDNVKPKITNSFKFANILIGLTVMVFSSAVAKLTPSPWDQILILISVVLYFSFVYFQRINFTSEQRTKDFENTKIVEDALLELMLVSADGNLTRVTELINFGADVNARSNSNSTALMFAARNNHLDIVKLLVKNGADVNAQNDKKLTAISIARAYGHNNVVDYLNALQAFKI